ncbi:MAG TPA: alpha/beta hydrolase [Verrucomicrobiae bacterium]|nr:alpha/beta hydrolase [Verrucomicrobiae bacterium]
MNKSRKMALSIVAIVVAIGLGVGVVLWVAPNFTSKKEATTSQAPHKKTGYAEVNGVNMYYEVHGNKNGKPPVLLLHGSHMNIELSFAEMIPKLAKDRQVVGIEIQGHGHTADVEGRPLTHQQVADDIAGFLRQQNITKADIFGWSMGGTLATELVLRHPELVRKVAVIGSNYRYYDEILTPEQYQQFIGVLDTGFSPKQLKEPYEKVSPHPEKWNELVTKLFAMDAQNKWPTDEQIKSIKVPFLIMSGDRDATPVSHALKWYSLLPKGQLDVLPHADHFAPVLQPQVVVDSLQTFLDAPENLSTEHMNSPEALDKR